MIDFFMSLETKEWIIVCLLSWIFIRVSVAIICSEEVNDYMVILDIAFLCLILAILYFNSPFQRHLKPTEQQRLNQEASEYFKDLPVTKLDSLKSGDVLEYGCSVCPYVVSNEAHLFSYTDTVITETVVKWLISDNPKVKDKEYVSVFRNFTSDFYGKF